MINKTGFLPDHVTLTSNLESKGTSLPNKIPIQNYINSDVSRTFSVCAMTPLWGHGKNTSHIINFVEIARLFGAQYFTFYNYTYDAANEIEGILEHYQKVNIAEVIQYPLPPKLNKKINNRGQHLLLHDCMYRNMFKSKYLVFIDNDEMIVPISHNNWQELIDDLSQRNHTYCGYKFRNTFFYNNGKIMKRFIPHLSWTERDRLVWDHHFKAKYIYDSRYVEVTRTHDNIQCLQGSSYTVGEDEGRMHHYREPPYHGPFGKAFTRTHTIDNTMLKFEKQIISSIEHRYTQFALGSHK